MCLSAFHGSQIFWFFSCSILFDCVSCPECWLHFVLWFQNFISFPETEILPFRKGNWFSLKSYISSEDQLGKLWYNFPGLHVIPSNFMAFALAQNFLFFFSTRFLQCLLLSLCLPFFLILWVILESLLLFTAPHFISVHFVHFQILVFSFSCILFVSISRSEGFFYTLFPDFNISMGIN